MTVINANKPHRWRDDIASSVDLYNRWFLEFAPKAFRDTRAATVEEVIDVFIQTYDLLRFGTTMLYTHPGILRTFRMSTAPPLAIDRLVGLADTKPSLIRTLENDEKPKRMNKAELMEHLERIVAIISELLDTDIFPWLIENRTPEEDERIRAAYIVADRLCGSIANPIIRNAQEKRQFAVVNRLLISRGYTEHSEDSGVSIRNMRQGTFAFNKNIRINTGDQSVKIPIDVVIQPKTAADDALPIFIEAKSSGDFANTNKRRKEEATKVRHLRSQYGSDVRYILLLGGYFDSGYLGYEAAEGIDWVWEHRVEDLLEIGL